MFLVKAKTNGFDGYRFIGKGETFKSKTLGKWMELIEDLSEKPEEDLSEKNQKQTKKTDKK